MKKEIQIHLEKALDIYSGATFLPSLIEAKDTFFRVTGNLNEEDEDYESRMNSFNDWYLTNYTLSNVRRTPLKDYVLKSEISEDVGHGLLNLEYSLYEFVGQKSEDLFIFHDLMKKKKIQLSGSEGGVPAILKGDLFTGRVVEAVNLNYFLPGICVLPKEIKGNLQDALKRVLKKGSTREIVGFLLKLEYLKTKSKRYGHLPLNKIFQFD